MEENGAMPETVEPGAADRPREDDLHPVAEDADVPAGDDPVTVDEPLPVTPLTLDEMVAELAAPIAVLEAEAAEAAPEADLEAPAPEALAVAEAVAEGDAERSAPELEEPDTSDTVPETPKAIVDRLWTRAPFWVVGGAFVVLVGTCVYLLWPLATGTFTAHPLYALFVQGGAALVLIGLVTGLVVWLSARSRAQDDEKPGLAMRLWLRALAWTAGGVAIWWIGLALLDLRHAGLLG